MSTRSRLLAGLAVASLALGLTACGGGGSGGGGFYGQVFVENNDISAITSFRLAQAGTGSYTGNLLGSYVLSGERRSVGSFLEDYYDAQAFRHDGSYTPWFNVFVEAGLSTNFSVF